MIRCLIPIIHLLVHLAVSSVAPRMRLIGVAVIDVVPVVTVIVTHTAAILPHPLLHIQFVLSHLLQLALTESIPVVVRPQLIRLLGHVKGSLRVLGTGLLLGLLPGRGNRPLITCRRFSQGGHCT